MTDETPRGPHTATTDTAADAEPALPPAIDPDITLAEFVEATEANPEPSVTILAALRERSFTGQVTFTTDPTVRAYFDRGAPYFAERDGDPLISSRLLEDRAVTVAQLERGTVRVGDAEHLGRLFDRDPSVDRDAVMGLVGSYTEAILHRLSRADATIELHAYRHHPSGIHRWFVAQFDVTPASRPVSDVAQVDRSVVDELPALGSAASRLRIEWNESTDEDEPGSGPDVGFDTGRLSVADEIYIEAELNRFDADWAGLAEPMVIEPIDDRTGPRLPPPIHTSSSSETTTDEFQIVWPDGTEQTAAADADVSPFADLPAPSAGATPVAFDPPKVVIDRLPEPDEEIPLDVADAVRQALASIENTTIETPDLPTLELTPAHVPDFGFLRSASSAPATDAPAEPESTPETTTESPRITAVPETPTAPAAPEPSAFAPPTPDTRAETMYARAAAEVEAKMEQLATADAPAVTEATSATPPARMDSPDDDRTGALRRLIGSLRRND